MNHNLRMLVRLCAFVVWALVAGSAVFWGLKVSARGPVAPSHAVAVGEASVTRGDLSKLLGTGPAPVVASAEPLAAEPDVAGRFKLVGVMAPKKDAGGEKRTGLALISVDGKTPKAYGVGAVVDGDMVLQRVSMRSAAIGPNEGAAVILEVPPLVPAATGSLPPVPAFGAAAAPPRPARPGRGAEPVPLTPQVAPQVVPPPTMAAPASMPSLPPMPQQRDLGAPTR